MNGSGPAFPQARRSGDQSDLFWDKDQSGMSLIDYFAGQVLSGAVALRQAPLDQEVAEEIATWAYNIADAMITEKPKRAKQAVATPS